MREVGKGELLRIVDKIIVDYAKEHGVPAIPRLIEDDEVWVGRRHLMLTHSIGTERSRSSSIHY